MHEPRRARDTALQTRETGTHREIAAFERTSSQLSLGVDCIILTRQAERATHLSVFASFIAQLRDIYIFGLFCLMAKSPSSSVYIYTRNLSKEITLRAKKSLKGV